MKQCWRREARTSGSACPRSFQGGKSLKNCTTLDDMLCMSRQSLWTFRGPLILSIRQRSKANFRLPSVNLRAVFTNPLHILFNYYRYAYSIPIYSHCTTIFVSYCKSLFITHQQGFIFIIMHLSIISPNVRRLKYVKTLLKPKSMVAKSPLYSI